MSSSNLTRQTKLLLVAVGLIVANSIYLFIMRRLPAPPRSEGASFFYLANALLHFGLGFGFIVPFVLLARAFARTSQVGATKLFGTLALLSGAVCLGFGVFLFVVGATSPYRWALNVHLAAAVACIASSVVYLALRRRRAEATEVERWVWTPAQFASPLVFLLPLLFLGISSTRKVPERVIENPPLPPPTADEEGGGKKNPFFPSSAQSVGNKFFPSEYFVDSKSCGAAGCHPDIYKQWSESAHHISSFNNQWYRKSIEYMQEVVGTESSKWCGGCHDMAILLTEMPGTGKPRMDFPIKDQVWPSEKFPEAHAGIGCAVCHSIVHVKSTMGQGDYLADYPPMHKYAITNNEFMKKVHNFIIRRAPEPHKKTFLKPFHKDQTAKFCSSCHKVHLDLPVNRFHWFRGFNDYDAWQQSGVSGQGARSFYYPPDGFKKCGSCHMPMVKSNDAGNIGGEVHSHRFPAANTALPHVYGFKEQMEVTKKFLTSGFITVDIFAMRRSLSADSGNGLSGFRRDGNQSNPFNSLPKSADSKQEEPQTASLMGGEVGGHETQIQAANVADVKENFIAPLSNAVLRRGEEVLIDVVVRTRKIGHAFPGGTFDAFDVWLELKAVDNKGRVLLWNGNLEPDGQVDRWAHKYRALLVDGNSNRINKRNAWAARARVYAKAIPPGAADTVHYRLKVPKDCGDRVTITAQLHYRKFEWWNTQFAFAGRPVEKGNEGNGETKQTEGDSLIKPAASLVRKMFPGSGRRAPVGIGLNKKTGVVTADWDNREWKFDADLSTASPGNVTSVPDLPIVTLARDEVTLRVADTPQQVRASQDDPMKLAERWNDYGIGFLLQGDFKRADYAFRQVMEVAPQWPEGFVNLGRVKWQEGNLKEAREVLEKAFKVWESKPDKATNPNVPKVHYFYARVRRDQGGATGYDDALKHLRIVIGTFPDDRVVRNQIGQILLRQRKYDEAIKEFKHTLTIDPEDVEAHYGLNNCYRGKRDNKTADRHQQLYERFKAVEHTDYLTGPYLKKNPWDNNESRQVHEHG
jgi:Flp pilus assembly protein TadD